MLHISNDQGRSFQQTNEFKPSVRDYKIFALNGMAYDQHNVLWIYWAWDECSDDDCTFTLRRWLYLSRSADSGKTFDHVLKLRGYLLTAGSTVDHAPYFAVGTDNNIHMLRDTAWYAVDKQSTVKNLIYTILPQGDPSKRQDYPFPVVSDSLEMHSISSFCLTENMRPLVSLEIYIRKTANHYLATTRFTENHQFSQYLPSPATKYISLSSGAVYRISYVSEPPEYLLRTYVSKSEDYGETFGDSIETNVYPYYIQASNLTGAYALYVSFGKPRNMTVFRYIDPMRPPIDTLVVGKYSFGTMAVDEKGGIHIAAVDTTFHTFYLKKDEPTTVHNEEKFLRSMPTLALAPNPFNNSTTITYRLPYSGKCKITIYDVLGRPVTEYPIVYASEGEHTIMWYAEKCTSGIYVVNIHFEGRNVSVKAIIVK